jgi:hypothetical protein
VATLARIQENIERRRRLAHRNARSVQPAPAQSDAAGGDVGRTAKLDIQPAFSAELVETPALQPPLPGGTLKIVAARKTG